MAYYFNLPLITQLTTDQQRAVEEIEALALSGGPGTGKSVVSLWRHIRNYVTGSKNSLLLTYTKTLEHYLKVSAKSRNTLAGNNINRTLWWLTHDTTDYDEIIIDEAQDIEKSTLEKFFKYTSDISYGADQRQSLYLNDKQLNNLLEWINTDYRFNNNVKITLNKNFRNSKEILLFTRSVFPDFMISQNTINAASSTGLKPIMKLNIGIDINKQVEVIIDIINVYQSDTHNIAILVPFQNMVDFYYNAIKAKLSNNIAASKYVSNDDLFSGLSGIHITTFKSSKGLEFDTVIMPEFHLYKWAIEKGHTITQNDYYVAFTRTKSNLFLLCKNKFPEIGDINTITIE